MSSITIFTRNILETGTVTVTGTADTGYPESRLYDRQVSLFWKDTVTEAKTFHVDQGADDNKAVDALFIEKHNFSGEDMQFQYSTDDFSADINDAVTDWAQGDNLQIAKIMSAAQTKRYWRVTLSSMTNPRCSEIFMSYGYELDVHVEPLPILDEKANVVWTKSVGGIERSTRFGAIRRQRQYTLLLGSTDLTNFVAAMDDLNDYASPFYLKDHDGTYIMVRLLNPPAQEPNRKDNYTRIRLNMIEIL